MMHDIPRFTLFEAEFPQVSVHVTAVVGYGCLVVSGEDFGELPAKHMGGSDYEYSVTLYPEETEKFFRVLCPNGEDPTEMLLRHFGNNLCTSMLMDYCDRHGIKYRFRRYASD